MKSINQLPILLATQSSDEMESLTQRLNEVKKLLDDNELKQSEKICLELTEIYPYIPETWAFLGSTLQRMELHAQALSSLRRAYELLPNDPAYIVRYAIGLAQNGNLAQAEKFYTRSIAIDPNSIHAYYSLLLIKKLEINHPFIIKIKAISQDPMQSRKDRVSAYFSLGKHYSDHNQYNEAFTAYAAGSQLKIQGIKPKKFIPDADFFADFNKTFYALFIKKESQREDIPAILISGLPRSGKSLLERLISSHSAVTAGGELAYFHSLVKNKLKQRHDNIKANLINDLCTISQTELFQAYNDRLRLLDDSQQRANMITDTSPASLSMLTFLPILNPHVPIVLCRRDSTDLAVSIFFKLFNRDKHLYSYDMHMLGKTIASCECLMDYYERHIPNPIISIKYEEMVKDPLNTTRRVWNFLNLADLEINLEKLEKTISKSKKVRIHSSHTMAGSIQIQTRLVGIGEHYRPHLRSFFEGYDEAKEKWDSLLSERVPSQD